MNIGGSWRTIEESFVCVSSQWKRVNEGFVYHSGAWRRFYAYDATAPQVVSFLMTTPTPGGVYGATTATAIFTLVFSEEITGLAIEDFDFVFNAGNKWSISSLTNPNSDQKTYRIQIDSDGAPDTGNVQLSVDTTGILDIALINECISGTVNSSILTIDTTEPEVVSFVASPASGQTLEASTVLTYSLLFSEPVTGLATSDFSILGTSTGWSIQSLTGSGAAYQLVVSETSTGSTTNGTHYVRIAQNGVVDARGNVGPTSAFDSSEISIQRKPGTPSITSVSSTDLTLHDRQINYTVSVPSGLTTVDKVFVLLYDSNDTFISQHETDITNTTGPTTVNGTINVGRNPGVSYRLRAKTLNTLNLESDLSTVATITTGSDKTPPVLLAPTLSVNTVTDPGSPPASITRTVTASFSNPSARLTNEVSSVTFFIYQTSPYTLRGQTTINKPGGGWGSSTLTRTFSSVASGSDPNTIYGLTIQAGVNYTVFARSTDIYGGVNSTADGASSTITTTALQYRRIDYVTNLDTYSDLSGFITSDSGSSPFGVIEFGPERAIDSSISSKFVTQGGDELYHFYQGFLNTYNFAQHQQGAVYQGVFITYVDVWTKKAQETYVHVYNNGSWYGAGDDPRNSLNYIGYATTNNDSWKRVYNNPSGLSIGTSTGGSNGLRLRVTTKGVSYSGVTLVGNQTYTLGVGARTWLAEVNYGFAVKSYTEYNY